MQLSQLSSSRPHCGSGLAVGGIGAIAIRLIRIPLHLLHEIPEAVADALNLKASGELFDEHPGTFSESPLLRALDQLPIEAPHH